MRVRSRRRLFPLLAAAAIPVVLASAAFACQSTVTLYGNPTTVAAGGKVKVTGNKYNSSTAFGPVEIRLDRRTGPVLASAPPAGGNISVEVTIPATTPAGYHILIATQYNKTTGAPCTGCPGRASIKVTPATASAGLDGIHLVTNPMGLAALAAASLAIAAVSHRRRRSTTVA